jgi:phosphoribosylanthranilate isomerase
LVQKKPLYALDFNSKLEVSPAVKDIEKIIEVANILNDKR